MKRPNYIVTTPQGQLLKLGDFGFAVKDIAVPVDIENATRFSNKDAAKSAVKKMWNLTTNFRIIELKSLDKQ